MNVKRFLEIAILLVCTGCGTLFRGVGMDVTHLKDRYEVRAKFGDPDPDVPNECDPQWTSDSYRTRRKVARPELVGPGRGMVAVLTLGTSELIQAPIELQRLREQVVDYSKQLITGSTLQFLYDSDGRVAHIYLDGYRVGPGMFAYQGEPQAKVENELQKSHPRIETFEPEVETVPSWNMQFPPITELK
jgi:hypothetical protein